MELVQWVVPQEDGSFGVGFAPAWSERMPAVGTLAKGGGPLRRRGAPLASRHLVYPLAIGATEDRPADDSPVRGIKAGALGLSLRFAIDVDGRALVPPSSDDVRLAGLLAELVRVVADLAEAAGLPATGIAPERERRGLEIAVGTLGATSVAQLADALCLFRVAVEQCAQARGLQLADALLLIDNKSAPLDARVARFLGTLGSGAAGKGKKEHA